MHTRHFIVAGTDDGERWADDIDATTSDSAEKAALKARGESASVAIVLEVLPKSEFLDGFSAMKIVG